MPSLFAPRRAAFAVATFFLLGATPYLAAQWIRYPSAGVPRKEDGSVDPTAKAPRLAEGKPDFSGIWSSDEADARKPGVPPNPYDATTSRRMVNLGAELKGGLPYKPEVAAIVKERTKNSSVDPHIRCLPDTFLRSYGAPHLMKFVHTPGLFITLNEWNASYRQVFTDARPLPEDAVPSWQGYSTAKWDGDTLVVDSIGFRDDVWIDWNGSPLSEAAKVREEFTRPDFGHIQIKVTVDDPKNYTKPWTVLIKERLLVDVELIDEMCLENEKSLIHMK